MSDFFGDKQYNDYFEKLNSRLDNEQKERPVLKPKTVKKKGLYKVIRLRRGFLALALILVFAVIVTAIATGNKNDEKLSLQSDETVTDKKEETVEKPKKVDYVADENTVKIPDSNDAKTAIVVRRSDGKIVAERNAHEKIYPASTLKIMTLLVAVENIIDLNDTFTMTYEITDPLFVADASVAGFLNGEKVTMRDLLYGMILPSGADGAMGLAVKIAGSEEAFVELMNKKVKEMGLENTHFTNVSGLHSEGNYSTAYDMAIITDYAYQNKLCREVLSTYQYTTQKTPQNPNGILLSSTLFSYMYGNEAETAEILGGKTGYVNEAGYCVCTFGKANESGEEYIAVTMGNSSKWPAFYGQIDLYKEFAK
ncbi:MAG: D-alanyl-D-alanine carboxypeptidase [Clostridia bacterium]|nr:D-alanyl-D-alanine carboxypeptidase [Clostridia bacterium]